MKQRIVTISIATAAIAAVAIIAVMIMCGKKIITISVEKVTEELIDYQFKTYDNLKFECTPTPFEAKELYVIQVKTPEDYENEDDRKWHIDYLADKEKELFGYEINRSEISSVIPSELEYFVQDGPQCSIYSSHTFTFTDGKHNDPLLRKSETNETDISTYTDLTKQPHATLNVNEKKVDLTKASEYAEQSFKKHFIDLWNSGEGIKAKDAIGVKGENGEINYFVIRLQHTLEGLGVNENGYVAPYSSEVYIKPSYMLAYMTSEDKITSFSNNYYYKIVGKEKIKKVISLTTATDILSNTLAQNLNYSVKDVEMKYIAVINGKLIDKKDNDTIEMRPMWSFVLNYSSSNSFRFINSTTAYVDAVTGNVYYCSYENTEESEPILK